ncbi:MAG: hypothetical protein ABL940_05650 [Bacteroidia bacterium]
MKKTTSLLCTSVLLSLNVIAQETTTETNRYKYNNNFDLALASNGAQSAVAISWVHNHAVTKNKKFTIGYGVRFTSQIGENLTYTTAPAKLTSGTQGPQAMFTETIVKNIDTLYVASSQNNMLNANINLQYAFTPKFEIGFNIDAVGFTFGANTNGNYKAQDNYPSSTQSAKPTTFNALLVSDNDLGSLNSELYARYWLSNKIALRAGASFMFTEYTTANKLRLDNNRFRNKSLMPMLAISFTPFK